MKDHCSPLECMSSFFSYNLYLRDKSRSFFAHMTIFCKKCLHKQLFLKMVEDRDINIYAVEKTTVVPLSVCRAFFVIMCICVANHVLLWFNKVNFFQEILTKAFFSQNGRTHRYKYLCRMKDHYSSLECMPSLLRYNLYLRDISGSFFAHGTIFVKNAYISKYFSKWWNAVI